MQPRFIMQKHLTSVSASMREPHVVSISRKWEYEKKHERERESLTLPLDYKFAFVHKYSCY